MIKNYYDIISNIENFVDALVVVDNDCNITYHKNFCKPKYEFDEKDFIGKKPWELWTNIKMEESTLYRAVKFSEKTYFKPQFIEFVDGQILEILDTTFELKVGDEIIGAASASIIVNSDYDKNFINISNMTTSRVNDLYNIEDIIGESEEIQILKHKIRKVSKTNSSILIYGATGTGKELVAQSIHTLSKRKNKRFISQNCAAIPETLLESIFFGTTKGSYTGAENKPGIFEIADGGTIFLDEINSMDLNMQAKILKAIEEKKITRIGGSEYKKVDVRIIAATNQLPSDCINQKLMREDLYYRLSSISINVPCLKDRKNDIPLLCKHFIDLYNKEMGMNIIGVSDEVLEILYKYNWKGNIREFKNTIEAAFNFTSSNILQKEDLPDHIQDYLNLKKYKESNSPLQNIIEEDWQSLDDALSKFEKLYILNKAQNISSLSNLADKLKISKQTLNYKLKKYNLKINVK